ncbi:MAG TPA: NAD(P)/FAD-dependent oxidoreductase [Phycicoccus sp.]|nr:NAD(P)/FAD-dependent oxidoreductase [Phycicoccus sp.]
MTHHPESRAGTQQAERAERTLRADVVVVGARCAGAATAMLLADAGHDVLVLDRASFPSDTVSTHLISRSGMVQLDRWGLLDVLHRSGAPRITTIEFDTVEGSVVRTVKDRYGIDHLLAPRRIVLDDVLQSAAVRAGARLETGVAVDDVLRDDAGRVVGVTARDTAGPLRVEARYVVGADGLGSRVARAVGAPVVLERPHSGAVRYAYFAGDWSGIEYHVRDGALAGVFPTHGGEACVWVCAPEDAVRRHSGHTSSGDDGLTALMADLVPGFLDRLDGTERTSGVRGMLRMPNHFRQAAGPGWALVGDAGHHRDAVTGHGISDAYRDAELLAGALDRALSDPTSEATALAGYGSTRDRMARRVFDITCELAAFPATARFVELQRGLAVAIDEQAAELASWPAPTLAAA